MADLKLNSSGGGSVTLTTPSTASNLTLTLPSASGTVATTTGSGAVFTNPTINGFTGDTSVINVGSGQFYKDTSGNIGIGTSSPLSVAGYTSFRINNATNGGLLELTSNNTRVLQLQSDSAGAAQITTVNNGSNPYLAFGTNSTERMRLDSSGNLLVGTTSAYASSRFRVKSSGTGNSTYNIEAENSAGTVLFTIRDDGYFCTGVAATSPYNATTASAANLFVNSSDGGLYRSTSSLKYKTNVQEAAHGLAELLQLRSVTYEGISKTDAGKTFGGLIAEEVHEAGLTEFVQYADDGTPDALAYGNMVSLCIKAIQELSAKNTELETRLAALEGK